MPTLSAVVAEHPDILSTIVCCLADGGPANVLPLASVCRWTCNAFAPSAEIWRTLCVPKWPSTATLSLDSYREFFLLRSKPPMQVKMGALGAYDDDAEDEHCADFKRVKTEGAALSASLAARRDAFAAPKHGASGRAAERASERERD